MPKEPERSVPPIAKTSKKRRPRHPVAEWATTVLLLLFCTTNLVQAYVIPSGSMENTLLVGDHILVDKLSYAPADALGEMVLPYQDVERGDIIVFRYPLDVSQNYVKRVAAVPGDRVRIANKKLFVNGVLAKEPYAVYKSGFIEPYRDNFPSRPDRELPERALRMLSEHVVGGELLVPGGQYFVLGDNRDGSSDSRYWGFVPRENIIGKPWLIYWSFAAPADRLNGSGMSLEHLADVALNFFSKTRWRRTFQLVRAE